MTTLNIIHGEALATLKTMADNSIHSIVTDPPYEIGISAKGWDSTGIAYSVELWKEALRVLKPGGALLCFGSSRTFFKVASSIEEAGFTIQSSIAWLYNVGQSKNPNMGYRIEVEEAYKPGPDPALLFCKWLRETAAENNITAKDYRDKVTNNAMWQHYAGKGQPALPPPATWQKIKDSLLAPAGIVVPEWVEELAASYRTAKEKKAEALKNRTVISEMKAAKISGGGAESDDEREVFTHIKTAAFTEEGKQWESWEETLTPAFEPIIVARKPMALLSELEANSKAAPGYGSSMRTSIAGNILEHGTGAFDNNAYTHPPEKTTKNVVIDEQLEEYIIEKTGKAPGFFYCPKPTNAERPVTSSGVKHSTVKPLSLMRWLVALVTPPGGTVLDIFAGSGSTLEAAALEGFDSIGIEMSADHVELCEIRKARVQKLLEKDEK